MNGVSERRPSRQAATGGGRIEGGKEREFERVAQEFRLAVCVYQ